MREEKWCQRRKCPSRNAMYLNKTHKHRCLNKFLSSIDKISCERTKETGWISKTSCTFSQLSKKGLMYWLFQKKKIFEKLYIVLSNSSSMVPSPHHQQFKIKKKSKITILPLSNLENIVFGSHSPPSFFLRQPTFFFFLLFTNQGSSLYSLHFRRHAWWQMVWSSLPLLIFKRAYGHGTLGNGSWTHHPISWIDFSIIWNPTVLCV